MSSSSNNNFVESQLDAVKLTYIKTRLEEVFVYHINCEGGVIVYLFSLISDKLH